MNSPKICEDCGCELQEDEDTFCEDCLYTDEEFDDEDDDE